MLLAMPGVQMDTLRKAFDVYRTFKADVLQQLQTESIYDQYADRQSREVLDLRRQESQSIPLNFDYARISGLSNELKAKLLRLMPENLMQAAQIEGITPAALVLLLAHIRKPDTSRSVG
jgi:tRNA uridine 5-carboxymethylaminomethyl modification enzyme